MRVVLVLVSLLGGTSLIVAGYLYDDQGYWGSVLLEVGVAMLLLAPLVLAERLLERRIESAETRTRDDVEAVRTDLNDVRQEVAQTRRRVDELGGEVADQLREEDEVLLGRIEQLGEVIGYEDLRRLLADAAGAGYIAGSGIRIAVPESENRISIRNAAFDVGEGRSDFILLNLESPTGAPLSVTIWEPGLDPRDFWAGVVRHAKKASAYETGLENVAAIVDAVRTTLQRAAVLRSGPRNREVGPIVELLPGGWALTDDGLDWAGDDGESYRLPNIELDRIRRDPSQFAVSVVRREGGWSETQRQSFHAALVYAHERRSAVFNRAIRGG